METSGANSSHTCDVVIVGGGPAGLAAALTLGRACRRVLLCDAGKARNSAASAIFNFVTRDGTPSADFRKTARDQLGAYPNVRIRNLQVNSIRKTNHTFHLETTSGKVQAQRVILCTGMRDDMLPIAGFKEAWGHSVFQCVSVCFSVFQCVSVCFSVFQCVSVSLLSWLGASAAPLGLSRA